MATLVIQSHRPDAVDGWLECCVASVRDWAAARGFDYRFFGDEALDRAPDWYREKAGSKLPVVADLARLRLAAEALAGGYDRVCWLDADVLVFAPDRLSIDIASNCAFGREIWVEWEGKKIRVRRNVHNAVCVFSTDTPVLPFLDYATERIIERIDPDHMAPQIVGPKLLSALHNIIGFELLDTVGALSPAVIADLASGAGRALDRLRSLTGSTLAAANLCASLVSEKPVSDGGAHHQREKRAPIVHQPHLRSAVGATPPLSDVRADKVDDAMVQRAVDVLLCKGVL